MNILKIGYFADGKWAHNAFNLLNDDPEIKIMFICGRYDKKDNVLKQLAMSNSIDYLIHPNINSEEFLSKVKKYNCDLFVSMSFNQIFGDQLINVPRLQTINCHAGKLPFYRGRNILNWVLINDEKEFGITVHYMDEGIDTGCIILQRSYPITDNDDYGDLLEVAFVECGKILYDAVMLIKEDKVDPIEQSSIHPIGFYCGMRKVGDEIINWNQTSREIFNFVRALSMPGPKARTKMNDKEIMVNKVKLIHEAVEYKGIPGQIVGKINKMPIIKTLDTSVIISEFEYEGTIKIGDRLI